MATFAKAIPHILKWEGGYVNDPNDNGGETYRGISRKNFPNWTGWAVIDAKKKPIKKGTIFPELEEKVAAFYRLNKWNKIYGDTIKNERVALFLFDWFVHSGYHAVKSVQRICNLTDDGVIGSKTISGINNYVGDLHSKLIASRIEFVKNIVKNRPSQQVYIDGWMNRIEYYKDK